VIWGDLGYGSRCPCCAREGTWNGAHGIRALRHMVLELCMHSCMDSCAREGTYTSLHGGTCYDSTCYDSSLAHAFIAPWRIHETGCCGAHAAARWRRHRNSIRESELARCLCLLSSPLLSSPQLTQPFALLI